MKNTLWVVAAAIAASGMAFAEVPPEIAKQLVVIGRGVCVPETAQLYRPLHPNPPYTGVSIARDISFGPDPKNVLDVFASEKGGGSRPVLIYVSGGAGNKLQGGPNGDVFYDNVMLWAVKNGMVGVNMQRRQGQAWDDPAKDVALVVQWVGQNAARYKGNPKRVFIWAQSAGNTPVGTYIGHPELYGPKGVGVKGVVFMSAPGFNILPKLFHRRSKAESRRVRSQEGSPEGMRRRPLDVDRVGREDLDVAMERLQRARGNRPNRTPPLKWLDRIFLGWLSQSCPSSSPWLNSILPT